MAKMNQALSTAIMGIIIVIVIEVLVMSLDTTGWNEAVVVLVATVTPIIVAAGVIMAVLKLFTSGE